MMLGGGPGNKRDRARFEHLTGEQQGRAAELAQALYDGTRTVARCWTEALDVIGLDVIGQRECRWHGVVDYDHVCVRPGEDAAMATARAFGEIRDV